MMVNDSLLWIQDIRHGQVRLRIMSSVRVGHTKRRQHRVRPPGLAP